MSPFLVLLCFSTVFGQRTMPSSPRCSNQKNVGFTCGQGQTRFTRWYFNARVNECISFTFRGCGGNDNNFKSKDDCEFACKPADSAVCSGNSRPRGICTETEACPDGFTCVSTTFHSYCCEAETERRFRLGHRPQCAFGLYTLEANGITYPLQADSCADINCPDNYHCENGEVWAHCCLDAPRTPTIRRPSPFPALPPDPSSQSSPARGQWWTPTNNVFENNRVTSQLSPRQFGPRIWGPVNTGRSGRVNRHVNHPQPLPPQGGYQSTGSAVTAGSNNFNRGSQIPRGQPPGPPKQLPQQKITLPQDPRCNSAVPALYFGPRYPGLEFVRQWRFDPPNNKCFGFDNFMLVVVHHYFYSAEACTNSCSRPGSG